MRGAGRHRSILLAAAVGLALSASPAGAARQQGIDVSRFDGGIDWERVADDGIRFAFVQASRGAGDDCAVKPRRCGRDGLYDSNYEGAAEAGIPVGAYHRAFVTGRGRSTLRDDAQAEAAVFIDRVGRLRPGDLRPALDFETPFADVKAEQLRLWVRVWLRRVEAALGVKPVIYTNTSSWAATGDTTEFALDGHPLWVANWHVRKPSVPAANWAGEGWSVWQHASDGSVDGIRGRVDLDVLHRGRLRSLTVH